MDKKTDKKDSKKLQLETETVKDLTVKTSIRAGNYTQQAGCTSRPIRPGFCNLA